MNYAFHERLGYLTACPTNVGTGMRVSVMLHLPALVITQQIEKVFRSLQKISLAVRGLYGEGSQAMGDFYQISNQITLGRSEMDLVKQVGEVMPVIIDYERQARAFLVKESRKDLHDRVSRAYGILCTAQTISPAKKRMHLLSSVRMGVNLGLIQDLKARATRATCRVLRHSIGKYSSGTRIATACQLRLITADDARPTRLDGGVIRFEQLSIFERQPHVPTRRTLHIVMNEKCP